MKNMHQQRNKYYTKKGGMFDFVGKFNVVHMYI